MAIGTTEVRLRRLTEHRFRSRRPSRRSLLVSGRTELLKPPGLLRQGDALRNRWTYYTRCLLNCQTFCVVLWQNKTALRAVSGIAWG